jgi:hypothetical protein
MPINPNTDFSSGAVLTAAQQNRFPRGVVAFGANTTTDSSITTEEITIVSSSFQAVANRYYRVHYYEPQINTGSPAGSFILGRIRLTNLFGTQLQQGIYQVGSANGLFNLVWVGTFTAGSTVVVATLASGSGTWASSRGATLPAQLIIEDIGPA